MSSDEWDEIKQIFEKAVRLPASERGDYLDRTCSTRSGIRRVVSDLIANHDSQESLYPGASVAERASAFEINQLVGDRFRITRLISRGGMGEVYEAYDEKLRTAIALKTVRLELAQDQATLARFRREIRMSHEVAHDCICRVFDLIEHRSANSDRVIPCLTMELLPGESLAQYLAKNRPLPPARVLPWVRQIASALRVLHAKDIVHRDLKPSNIMLVPTRDGALRAVVMDFGLARPVHNDPEMFETRTDLHAGAPYFMAPELLTGERPSVASDVYAFGLVIDEMVTRSRAFTAQALHYLLFQKLLDKPIAPAQRADDLPLRWERVILKCLDPSPENRFSSIEEVMYGLDDHAVEQASDLAPVHRFTRRKLALAAASVPVLAAGAVLGSLALKPLSAGLVAFPIANETGRKDYDYICKITDSELLRRLSGVPGIGAVAYYAPRAQANQKLDTRFILDGRLSAVARGFQMVLTLTDNATGQVFWTHEFDPFERPASLDLQTEATQRVIEAIDSYTTFGSRDSASARMAPLVTPLRKWFGSAPTKFPGTTTGSPEAWEHYSRAHQLLDRDSEKSILAGIDLLKRATATDPNFALGYAALSRAYILLSGEVGQHAAHALSDAENYALRSLACDQELPEPHVFLAAVHQNRWEWNDATVNFSKAIQLRPRFPQALRWYGGLLVQFASFDQGLAYSSRAIEVDPYGVPNYLCHGFYLFLARRYDDAIRVYTSQRSDTEPAMLDNLTEIYAWRGHISTGQMREHWFQQANYTLSQIEADEKTDIAQDGSAPNGSATRLRAYLYSLSGDLPRARPYLAKMEASVSDRTSSPADLARCYSVIGDQKAAVELLERAYVIKDPQLMFLKVHPAYDTVRSHPLVQDILQAMKLA